MIIGLDENYNIISKDLIDDPNAYSVKDIDEQEIDLEMYNYKYESGMVINLGLKREFTMTEEEKIKEELVELDKVINRATEDLYELTETEPYKSTAEVMERKKELRQQLKQINQ